MSAIKTGPILKKKQHFTCYGQEFVKMEDCITILQDVTILVAIARKGKKDSGDLKV